MNSHCIQHVKTLYLTLLIFLLFLANVSMAQMEKGSFSIGSSFFVQFDYSQKSPTSLYVQTNNGLSYFILKNVEAGVTFNLTKVRNNEYGDYHNLNGEGVGLAVRYYVPLAGGPADKKPTFFLFFQAGGNYAVINHYTMRDDDTEEIRFEQKFNQFNVHPGLMMLLGKHWSFECSLRGVTYETYKVGAYKSDFFGLGLNSIPSKQWYHVRTANPGFYFLGGIRFHF